MRLHKHVSKPPVVLFVNRLYLFLFCTAVFALLLFTAGLFREFTGETLSFLLTLINAAGFFLGVMAVYGAATSVWLFTRGGQFRHIVGALCYLASGAFVVAVSCAGIIYRITLNGGLL
jgi:hypothetical protein